MLIPQSQLHELANLIVEGLRGTIKGDEEWITPQRAAQIIGCKVRTLRSHVAAGRLIDNEPGRGGTTLYRLDTVHACRFHKMNSNKLIK